MHAPIRIPTPETAIDLDGRIRPARTLIADNLDMAIVVRALIRYNDSIRGWIDTNRCAHKELVIRGIITSVIQVTDRISVVVGIDRIIVVEIVIAGR
jgi:hypothetical protein